MARDQRVVGVVAAPVFKNKSCDMDNMLNCTIVLVVVAPAVIAVVIVVVGV